MSRYELTVLLASWGLRVDLELSVRVSGEIPHDGISVSPNVWLVIPDRATVWKSDVPHVLRGLRRVAGRVQAELGAEETVIVFELEHLWYPLTDSQDDAIELAVAGWAAEELRIQDEPATVAFDREANRYLIEFNRDAWQDKA